MTADRIHSGRLLSRSGTPSVSNGSLGKTFSIQSGSVKMRPMKKLLLPVLLATALYAQAPEKSAEVDRIFSEFNNHTPGCSVAAARNGTVVLEAGYGMADLERNVPITQATIFESGSLAKQFTAASLMLLAQDGKISLDDPLRKYLPELQVYSAPVTIRQVLSHVSGLRDWRALATFSGLPEDSYVYSNSDLLRLATRQRALNYDPGAEYSYSNTGFNLAPIVIERALGNGTSFQAFTQQKIFGPLGMIHTRWRDDYRRIVPNRALAYDRAGNGWIQQTPIENIIGAGGLLTTVGDLLLWNENFTHARVGGPEMVKAQQTLARLTSGRTITYAAGLVVTTVDGVREVAHSGSTGGYRTWLGRYPDQKVPVAVMCNAATANPTRLGRATARLWTGAAPAKAEPYHVNPESVKTLAGMYRKLRDNTVIEFQWKDGKLLLERSRNELVPVAAGRFEAASGTQYAFEDGAPFRMRVVTPDGDILYEKVEPVQPTPTDIAAFTGKYESAETDSQLVITASDKPGELILRVGFRPSVTLRPTFRDAFATPTGSSIRFLRDSDGKLTGLSAGEDRVWDLRFTRAH
jgi:CubicO group peptidase (beta-lactamase class C family)